MAASSGAAAGRRPRNPEEEEFEEADQILAELKRRAATGESDMPWGDCIERQWAADGTLHVLREYSVTATAGGPRLVLRELPYSAHPSAGIGVNGTGGVVWPGAVALVEMLRVRLRELLPEGARSPAGPGPVLVELGAGCGLVGLCAAVALADAGPPPARVVLTDESEAVLANLRHNVDLNRRLFGTAAVEVSRLEWGELLAGDAASPVESADLVLGSDVIWGERGPLVGRVARRLVRPGGVLVISAQEGREGLDAFEAALRLPERKADQGFGEGPPFDVEVGAAEAATGDRLVLFVCRRAPRG